LSKTVYSLYANWLGVRNPEGEALAEAAGKLWSEWPAAREARGWSRVSDLWIDDQPVFIFKHALPDRLVALVARQSFLERRWRGVLTDDRGRLLLGRLHDTRGEIRLPVAG